jgi:hypothetical protein
MGKRLKLRTETLRRLANFAGGIPSESPGTREADQGICNPKTFEGPSKLSDCAGKTAGGSGDGGSKCTGLCMWGSKSLCIPKV